MMQRPVLCLECFAELERWWNGRGLCQRCNNQAAAREILKDHDLLDLVNWLSSGESWKTIAARLDIPGPIRGPRLVALAAEFFWEAAGKPGSNGDPPSTIGNKIKSNEAFRAWHRARDECIALWLRNVACLTAGKL